MVNMFIIRKYAALLLCGFFPLIAFVVGANYGFFIGMGVALAALIVIVLLGSRLLKNPFSAMLEGRGIMALKIDSTGVIKPFILAVHQPYLKGRLDADGVHDVYDRSTVYQLAEPKKAGKVKIDTEGQKIKFELDEGEYNKARFGLFQYPCVIYNSQIKSLVTKDFLSENEKHSFAEHGVLFLNRQMEELTANIRDFARHVVEQLKPKDRGTVVKWIMWVVFILIGIIVIMFLPSIWGAVKGTINSAGGSIPSAPVTPR